MNSKSVSDMLREVATVSPLFFKEVRPQSPLLKLFLEFYLNSFGKKLPFHKGLSVLRRFQTKLSLLSFPHDIVCRPLFSKRLSQNQVYLTLIHLSPKMFFSSMPLYLLIFVNIWNVDTAIIGFGFIVIISRAPGKENTLE